MFSKYVVEQLKSYVYLLIDPRNGDDRIFYVGKGHGNRVFTHVQSALAGRESESDTSDRIREIHAAGHEVQHELLRFGLADRTALEIEAAAIQLLGLGDLTNAVEGHHKWERGRMTTDVATSQFDAPQAPPIAERAVLFRIPRRWSPVMSPAELYESTRGWWRMGRRREDADYAFAVSQGVIREVYEIHGWRQRGLGDRGWEEDIDKSHKRWGFSGEVAGELAHYRITSVRHLFKKENSSPFKYVNC
ncbi:MAG: GIY-YIG nuclease family protein [Acidimicrobiaceae bacterium]|nr:GIY-YIG nuclease family protein [Acidimicrobiaceae bacterium]